MLIMRIFLLVFFVIFFVFVCVYGFSEHAYSEEIIIERKISTSTRNEIASMALPIETVLVEPLGAISEKRSSVFLICNSTLPIQDTNSFVDVVFEKAFSAGYGDLGLR